MGLAHFNAGPLVANYKIIIFTRRLQRAFTQNLRRTCGLISRHQFDMIYVALCTQSLESSPLMRSSTLITAA